MALCALAVAVSGALAGQGSAAAAAPRCDWAPTAARLATALADAHDQRGGPIRDQLRVMGFAAGAPAAGCTDTAAAPPPGPATPPVDAAGAPSAVPRGTSEKHIVPPDPASGRTLRVGGGGPYPTIAAASAAAKPGDTVRIAAGTYPGFTPTSGARGAYVTYTAAPGATVVIAGAVAGKGLIGLDGRSWVHLDGLSVRDSAAHGIYGTGVDHVVLTRMEVARSRDGGIVLRTGGNVALDGCDVHGNNSEGAAADHQAVSLVGITTFEILNTKVHKNGEEGIDASSGSGDGAVHHNRVWGNAGPNVALDAVHDVSVHDNQIWDATATDGAGIALTVRAAAATERLAGVTVRDNTVRDNKGPGLSFRTGTTGRLSGITVEHNAIGGNGGNGITFTARGFDGTTIKDNTFGDGDSPPGSAPGGVSVVGNVTGTVPRPDSEGPDPGGPDPACPDLTFVSWGPVAQDLADHLTGASGPDVDVLRQRLAVAGFVHPDGSSTVGAPGPVARLGAPGPPAARPDGQRDEPGRAGHRGPDDRRPGHGPSDHPGGARGLLGAGPIGGIVAHRDRAGHSRGTGGFHGPARSPDGSGHRTGHDRYGSGRPPGQDDPPAPGADDPGLDAPDPAIDAPDDPETGDADPDTPGDGSDDGPDDGPDDADDADDADDGEDPEPEDLGGDSDPAAGVCPGDGVPTAGH